MAGIINTGSFPQDLRPGIHGFFGAAYPDFIANFDRILDVKEADERAYEEDVMIAGLGLAVTKPQGSPVSYDSGSQEWSVRYPHIVYGLGFQITQEMMEDSTALKMGKVFSESLKKAMMKTREVVAANVLNNGFSSSYLMQGGDGVQLFSNAHPTRTGNQTNVPATIASLSEASLEQAIIDITNQTDTRGTRIHTQAKKLIVPNALQFQAARILRSPLQSNSADNNINVLKSDDRFPEGIIMDPYLTSATGYFIKTDVEGANFFNRKEMMLTDDNDFDTTNMKFKGLMRFSVGWTDWRCYYGVNA